jgi:SPP1 family predicted phage head-tail adaptor
VTIGARNRRVLVEQRSTTRDSSKQAIDGWELIRETYASIDTLTGGEALRAQAIVSSASVEIEMRYRPGITAAMRVRYGNQTFDIGAVIDVGMRHETLRLICTTGLNQGG